MKPMQSAQGAVRGGRRTLPRLIDFRREARHRQGHHDSQSRRYAAPSGRARRDSRRASQRTRRARVLAGTVSVGCSFCGRRHQPPQDHLTCDSSTTTPNSARKPMPGVSRWTKEGKPENGGDHDRTMFDRVRSPDLLRQASASAAIDGRSWPSIATEHHRLKSGLDDLAAASKRPRPRSYDWQNQGATRANPETKDPRDGQRTTTSMWRCCRAVRRSPRILERRQAWPKRSANDARMSLRADRAHYRGDRSV